jgi:hypothetical protein
MGFLTGTGAHMRLYGRVIFPHIQTLTALMVENTELGEIVTGKRPGIRAGDRSGKGRDVAAR